MLVITLNCFQPTLYKTISEASEKSKWMHIGIVHLIHNYIYTKLALTLVPLCFSSKRQPTQSWAELPPRGPQTGWGNGTMGTFWGSTRANARTCTWKGKTSQAPWEWQVAQWRCPWELPSLPDLLEILKQWCLLTTLGFLGQLSLRTYPFVRLQGSPDQASDTQRLLHVLLLHQPFLRARFCSHLALKGLMAVLYSYLSITDICKTCNCSRPKPDFWEEFMLGIGPEQSITPISFSK